ncbi:MAG: hypothetical protein KGQ59_11270 [Bdellovibrionales bacterium]|nr:hypothetical protein [Bdellovibrionales bacterium]
MVQARQKRTQKTQRVIFPESVSFPKSWNWFMDQSLTQWVKNHYSPRDSWKGKPFGREDAHFFFKGIEELSEIFTQDRGRALQRYFEHPRFRSGYLLYFLPLQAAKFIAVLNRHSKFLAEALQKSDSTFRVVDLGAGPCTASIALLLWLLDRVQAGGEIPQIEITAVDIHGSILQDGAKLVELIASSFPRLRGKVKITTECTNWQDWARKSVRLATKYDLTFLGHVLNESRDRQLESWSALYSISRDAGILAIEPASKGASQGLSQLRDEIFTLYSRDSQNSESDLPTHSVELQLAEGLPEPSIVGPCPHFGACPMSEGPDWCHFSFPAQLPGEWFNYFSKGLGSERQWLKFSYLWMTPKKLSPSQLPLLISDALQKRQNTVEALVCRQERAEKISFEVPLEKLRGPLGLRGGWLAEGGIRPTRPSRKKESAGPPKGTNRKGRPEKMGKYQKGR